MIARRLTLAALVSLCALTAVLAVSATPAFAVRGHVFEREFGSKGTGAGQFEKPTGMAVNEATGDVYVVDKGNNRVEYFTSEGVFLGEFTGPSATGSGMLTEGSGTSAEESAFLDASASGGDVFFLTQSKLSPQDFDDALDIYDAQVCTSAEPCATTPTSPPACVTAEGCRAAPAPQPTIFGASGSATFSGAGNLAPPPPLAKVTKKIFKCKKAFTKKHNKCVKEPRKKSKGKKSAKGRK